MKSSKLIVPNQIFMDDCLNANPLLIKIEKEYHFNNVVKKCCTLLN